MNMAQQAQGASRFTGIGVVILVHALMIAGLSTGLAHSVLKKAQTITKARVIEDEQHAPPPPVPRADPVDPTRKMVIQQVPVLDTPDFTVTPSEVPPGTATGTPVLTTGTGTPAGPTLAPPSGLPAITGPVSPALVCTRMGKPDLPSVNWSGDALFRVQATVQAGRVAATEFTLLSGLMDARTRRALQSALATTLRDTYECPGEHRFEQEFKVRID